MERHQLPGAEGEFAGYFGDLLSRLDQRAGWCGVFWQRDPEGMTACLDGQEVPPWDVVQALLHDLAADRGTPAAEREADLARPLHRAALAAHDTRPGSRRLLAERLDLMLGEERYAIDRQDRLTAQLSEAPTPHEADRIQLDLAWARDDEERARARSEELRARIAELDEAAEQDRVPQPRTADRKKRPRGARYGWVEADDGSAADEAGPLPVPDVTPGAVGAPEGPRGARFAGGAGPVREAGPQPGREPDPAAEDPATEDPAAEDAAARAVRELVRLRAEGRAGEAYALLCEAVLWPAPRLPLLAEELEYAGLGADWVTLLWEGASLSVERLVAAADALAAAGRADDGAQLLRQGVARPAPEIADAVLALRGAGREREVVALLDAYVRVRSPQEAARFVLRDPARLTTPVLDAARAVSPEREWDVVHALRVAGIAV
ncbi:hypothetical protein QIT00_02445 [Streptomyces sp. B-S-A12]|uniref:UL36 very large tegument protein n=2 Tax=Streptomyces luteolus TaxID=3043615 RepID=A0ABT6SP92_9ACTN|nr:hypothetical protein [Streptomyces sp. B-S-A12]MDI3417431.1 hypothetical protein [Streptomyces sp. B-S-A12]